MHGQLSGCLKATFASFSVVCSCIFCCDLFYNLSWTSFLPRKGLSSNFLVVLPQVPYVCL